MTPVINGSDLYIGNDNLVTLDRLLDKATNQYINDATVTFDLRTDYSPSGTSVASGTLEYVAGSNGKYQAVIEEDTTLTEGTTYYQEITVAASSDRVAKWQTPRTARRRTS